MDVLWLICIFNIFIITKAECDVSQCTYSSKNSSYTCANKGCTSVPALPSPADLTVVHLQHNNITEITERFLTPKLLHLDLSSNKIRLIDSLLFTRCHQLQTLDLSGNNISQVETATFTGLNQLRRLFLSNNQIKHLEADLFARVTFLNLVSLDLSSNKIKTVHNTAINDLSNLTSLRLSHNRLDNGSLTQDHFRGLKSLLHLYLDFNYFTELGSGVFKKLPLLNVLDLKQNSIKTIAKDAFDGLLNVMDIQLQWNSLQELKPDTFNLKSLKSLNLNHNYFVHATPLYFTNCTAVKLHLSFQDVLVTVRENTFKYMSSLQTLYLSDNKVLSSIHPDSIKTNSTITDLDLSNNSLQSLSEDLIDWEFVKIDLSRNPWKCDAKIKWMVEYKMRWKHRKDTRCSSPDHLKGRSIYELSPGDFTLTSKGHTAGDIVIGLLICSAFFVIATVITVLWKYRDRILSQARTARYKFLYSGGEDMEDDKVTFNVTEDRSLMTTPMM